jgi:hypothetical protein
MIPSISLRAAIIVRSPENVRLDVIEGTGAALSVFQPFLGGVKWKMVGGALTAVPNPVSGWGVSS